MKKKLILILGLVVTLSLSSCTSKSEEPSTSESPVPTIESNSTIESEPLVMEDSQTLTLTPTPPTESGGLEEPSTSSTESVEDTTSSEGDLLATVPKDIYDPEDFTTPLDDQWKKVDEAYDNGLITDRQYTAIYFDTRKKQPNGSSTTTTDGTGSTASGDTYIPAHGNPGTVMSNEDTGKTNDHTQADMSWAIGATIE